MNIHTYKIGQWFVGETLGKGGFSWVKKGYDSKSDKIVALKFVRRHKQPGQEGHDQELQQVKVEIEALKQIRHEMCFNSKTPSGSLLVLEHMPGGQLADIFFYSAKISEIVARTYFRQLIEGVEACHRAMVIHRDIKLQNLLLDKHFSLKVYFVFIYLNCCIFNRKITDFGLAKIIKSDRDLYLVLKKQNIKKSQIAITCVFQGPPFEQALITDPLYAFIVKGQYKEFWLAHQIRYLSIEAMDVITRMLCFNSDKRVNLAKIKQHPWYKSEILQKEELYKVLRLRHTQMEWKRYHNPIKLDMRSEFVLEKFVFPESDALHPLLRKHLECENKTLMEEAPASSADESIAILDSFTQVPALVVLNSFLFGCIQKKVRFSANFQQFLVMSWCIHGTYTFFFFFFSKKVAKKNLYG
ncbi:hypothetical protein RFI_29288 [Reticulomyxa filosa]|uniref:Protein kinase domain-containing protein n=1 Tax=Reticulomyxa filosa TaxID=46433 RepID=X6M2I3_RETFI|nr:hypothetical protein RFI_29288 [Reticulomyxa filosa]|eukprot:ETO08099.1 hypothetical protein RFI_29288 [Reticulomyxa filosa]